MKKLINVATIVSVALAGAAVLVLLLCLTVLWKPLAASSFPPSVVEAGPVLPLSITVNLLITLAMALVLIGSSKNEDALGASIVVIGVLILLVPVLSPLMSFLQTTLINQRGGVDAVLRVSAANHILSFPSFLSGFASNLCLVVCGMRIAGFINAKKTAATE